MPCTATEPVLACARTGTAAEVPSRAVMATEMTVARVDFMTASCNASAEDWPPWRLLR